MDFATAMRMIVSVLFLAGAEPAPVLSVVAEEDVYNFVSPNNGSGPLWCSGCTVVARLGEDVFASQMETGEGVPLLCNTRWRLLRRTAPGWSLVSEAEGYRQREPCPLAVTAGGFVFLYANDSTEPPGTKYGPCVPALIRFKAEDGELEQQRLAPQWRGTPYFTDHSYRGFAADFERRQLLMLNIDAKSSVQNACLLSESGETLATGAVSFPIRACYSQVALRNGAVYVQAIGDIVEPVEAWRKYKYEQTKQDWDYVFRILYYTWTPDLRAQDFATPIEIANVDATGGYIGNQDLWISPEGQAYLLYTQQEVQSALLRDKFFPGKSLVNSLCLAIVENGQIVARKTLITGSDTSQPGTARFHEASDGTLYAVVYVSGENAGNKLLQIRPEAASDAPTPVPLKNRMGSFCLATVRAGNRPSDIIDMFGHVTGDRLSYAQIRIEKPKIP